MQGMIAGEKEGLHSIYQAYVTYIYAIIYDILKNKEDAEDVTAEFFIKLWNIAGKYQFGGKHRAWLGKIAHNMAIDYIRTRKYHDFMKKQSKQRKSGRKHLRNRPSQNLL